MASKLFCDICGDELVVEDSFYYTFEYGVRTEYGDKFCECKHICIGCYKNDDYKFDHYCSRNYKP